MKYVIIYGLDNNAEQHEVARCEYTGTAVKCSGEKVVVKNLEEFGIVKDGVKLLPKDGIKFLEALVGYFKSGYMTTSEILDT